MNRLFGPFAFLFLLSFVLGGCQNDPSDDDDDDDAPSITCGADETVVRFDTADGETLEADYWPADAAGAPIVALFHMNPVAFDRTGYPQHVRQAIHDLGVNLLNVDRRGAGGSTGNAEEATTGPGGAADVRAAVSYLTSEASGCPGDPDRLNLVGASNGTTGVYDYVVTAESEFPFPKTVVFMSPGEYTETNFPINSDPEAGGWNLSFPILWIYPDNEDFSDAYVPDAPGAWDFQQLGGEHGTNMFDGAELEGETVELLTSWIAQFGAGDDDDSGDDDDATDDDDSADDDDDSSAAQEAAADNDSMTAPLFDHGLVNYNPANTFEGNDDISTPGGDTEDWVAFRTQASPSPTTNIRFILDCSTKNPGHVQMELWDNEGSSPTPITTPPLLPNCTGDENIALDVGHEYLIRIHWSQLADGDYSTWSLKLCNSNGCN